MASFLYDFNGTDTTSGVPTPTGHPTLEEVSGTWRRLSNRAYTSTSRNNSPILAATLGGGDVDLSASVSSGGGDALYVRVTDAANWIRARIRTYTVSSGYYTTEYEWEGGFYYGGSGYEHTHYSTAWSSSNSSCPHSSGYIHSHLVSGDNLSHSHSRISCTLTGNTRQVWNSSSSTARQVIIEKSVDGTITTLGTASISAPSTLRVRAQGTTVQAYINGSSSASVTVTETAFTTIAKHGIGRGPSDQDGQALDNLSIDPLNSPPNAPTLNWPTAVNIASTTRFPHTFSDPDTGDTQSKFDVEYWVLDAPGGNRVGAATVVTVNSPNQWWDAPGGTFTAGPYEGQVLTYDAQGTPGPSSSSSFFTAAAAPGIPVITYPTSGGTVDQNDSVSWSAPTQAAYQVQILDELDAVVFDETVTGTNGATTRTHALAFPVNNVARTIQVRIEADGLWSDWATVPVNVSYTPPQRPLVTLTGDDSTGSMHIAILNPLPEVGEPEVVYNDIYIDDGKGESRRATEIDPNSGYRYMLPVSGRDYSTGVRVVAHATNGTTASSL